MNLSKQKKQKSKKFAFKILSIALLLVFGNLQLAQTQDTDFWSIKVANYLNPSEAIQELQRLENLGFDGQIIEVLENDTAFHQLHIGCFLNEATAKIHLLALRTQLYYPSLSSTQQYSEYSEYSKSSETMASHYLGYKKCLGYETGIKLTEKWQIISTDEVFLLSIRLLDYGRIFGFNGDTWHSLNTETEISDLSFPEKWLATSLANSSNTSNSSNLALLKCESLANQAIHCSYGAFEFDSYLNGDILWQNRHTVLYKNNDHINLIRVKNF